MAEQNLSNITATAPSPMLNLTGDGKDMPQDPGFAADPTAALMGQSASVPEASMLPLMQGVGEAQPAQPQGTGKYVQAALQGWNRVAQDENAQAKAEAFKKLLDQKEKGAQAFIEETRQGNPGAEKYIPPTWPYKDANGNTNYYEWYKRAWYGVQLYNAQKASKDIAQKTLDQKATIAASRDKFAEDKMKARAKEIADQLPILRDRAKAALMSAGASQRQAGTAEKKLKLAGLTVKISAAQTEVNKALTEMDSANNPPDAKRLEELYDQIEYASIKIEKAMEDDGIIFPEEPVMSRANSAGATGTPGGASPGNTPGASPAAGDKFTPGKKYIDANKNVRTYLGSEKWE